MDKLILFRDKIEKKIFHKKIEKGYILYEQNRVCSLDLNSIRAPWLLFELLLKSLHLFVIPNKEHDVLLVTDLMANKLGFMVPTQ